MVVVLLGDTELFDGEFGHVRRAVEARDREVIVVNTTKWPGDPPVAYSISEERIHLGEPIPLEDVTGVFTMGYAFNVLDLEYYGLGDKRPRVAYRQLREWRSLFESVLSVLEDHGANVTFTPAERYWMRVRPWMLDLYEREDIPVPETTFTNDRDRVGAFLEQHDPAVVMMVNGGGVPRLVERADLTSDLLDSLATAPIKLQEFVPGRDARGFVVDGELVDVVEYDYDGDAFSHKRPDVDFEAVTVSSFDPSERLRTAVTRAGRLTPSPFSAIDLRRRPDGSFAILEANNPGRFTVPEQSGETAVSEALAEFLVADNGGGQSA